MERTPEEINHSAALISRRALIVGAMQLSVIGGLGARMHYLQIDQAERFRTLSESNRINTNLLAPARGGIFDRAYRPVAVNTPNYRLKMKRESTNDVEQVLSNLQRLIYIDPANLEKARKRLLERARFQTVMIIENLTWEDFAKVSANLPSLPGVIPDVGLSRIYPQQENLAHVVGYVGPVSDYDLSRIENPDPLLRLDRFQLGKSQIEAKMENDLRGSAGRQLVEVNAAGRVMRELERVEGGSGADLTISVDSRLQNYVLARMEGQSASAVVMDVKNGDLLAVASAPSFDPNMFVRGISTHNYRALMENKFGPMRAKAVQGTYSPASTFKMIVALAALDAGVVDPEETIQCNGHIEVSNTRFHCWKRYGHGPMNFEQSLMQSCDVYYYTIAQRVGMDRISEMARKFGLGTKYDLPLSAVRSGNMPDRAWKQRVHGKDWIVGDTVNASIGQGYLSTSPLQLAVMAARLATGRGITPRLILQIDGVDQPSSLGDKIDVNPDHLALVQKAMFGVCNKRRGTAFSKRLLPEEMVMAGKTGTSQVRRITTAERAAGVIRNEDRKWEHRDHALFVNYAPYNDPKIAVSIVVEHGGGGSSAAAPIARDITAFALSGGMPSLDVYPSKKRTQIASEQQDIASKLRDFSMPISENEGEA